MYVFAFFRAGADSRLKPHSAACTRPHAAGGRSFEYSTRQQIIVRSRHAPRRARSHRDLPRALVSTNRNDALLKIGVAVDDAMDGAHRSLLRRVV